MSRPRLLAVFGAVGLAAVPAVASASTSHAKFWQNKAMTVTCGVEIHLAGKPATEVLCAAKGIPAPPHTTSRDGDPGFVQLAATGSPRKLRLSQNSFTGTTAATLGHGKTWSSLGVTCTTGSGKTVLCFNGDNHGFVIGNGHYVSF
jgi:hypothetical protein